MLNINNEYNILGTKFLIKLLTFLAIIIVSFAANSFIFNGTNVIGVFVLWTITSILFYLAIKKDFGKYSDEVANEIKNYSLYKDIVATSNNAAVVIDDNFKVVTFNEAAQRVLFATSIVLKTSSMHDFLYEEDVEAFKEYVLEGAGKEKSFRIKNAYFETFDRQYILSFFPTKYIVEDKILYLIIINNFSEFYNNFSDVKKDKELLLGAINAIPLDIIIFDEKERSVFNKNQNDINTFLSLLDTIQLNKNVVRQGFDIAKEGNKFQQNIIVSNLNQIEKWQNLNFVPFKANDKNYVLYFQHDNTDYVKKYENLTNISNTYDGILRNSANAIIIVDTDGNIVELNPSFYQLYNLNADLISKDHFKIPLKDFLLMLNIDSIILNPDKVTKKVIYKNGSIAAGIDTFFLNILDAEVFEAELSFIKVSDTVPTSLTEFLSLSPIEKKNDDSEKVLNIPKDSDKISVYNKNYPVFDMRGALKYVIMEFTDISNLKTTLEKYSTISTYLITIANNFFMGIIFIVNENQEIVFMGGEEAIRDKLLIKGLSSKELFHFSSLKELNVLTDAIQATFEGNRQRKTHVFWGNHYDVTLAPIRDIRGNIRFCLGIGFNIEEYSVYEKKNLEQKLFYETIFAEVLTPIFVINSEWNIVNANKSFLQTFNTSLDKLLTTDMKDATNYTQLPELYLYALSAFQGETVTTELYFTEGYYTILHTYISKPMYFSTKISPIFDPNGNVSHIILILQDITYLKNALAQLEESKDINDIVLSNFKEGSLLLLDVDLSYKLIAVNEDFQHMKEWTNTSIKDNNIVIEEYDFMKLAQRVLLGEKFQFETEYTNQNTLSFEDSTKYYQVALHPVKNEAEEIVYVLITMLNITDRKHYEHSILEFNAKLDEEVLERTRELRETSKQLENKVEELNVAQSKLVFMQSELKTSLAKEQEINEMKSRFISLISHEYRTPLTVIQTYTYLLEKFFDTQNKAKFLKSKENIVLAIDTMVKLLDNVLFLEDSDKVQVVLEKVDIVEVLSNILEEARSMYCSLHNLHFISEVESLHVNSDIKMLKQIVNNLVSNAASYSPEKSDINVTLKQVEDYFVICVEDHGSGIHSDVADKIFTDFVRSAQVTNIPGSGLGLFITKRCVDYLNGSISFVTKINEGTTFKVKLPINL